MFHCHNRGRAVCLLLLILLLILLFGRAILHTLRRRSPSCPALMNLFLSPFCLHRCAAGWAERHPVCHGVMSDQAAAEAHYQARPAHPFITFISLSSSLPSFLSPPLSLSLLCLSHITITGNTPARTNCAKAPKKYTQNTHGKNWHGPPDPD